MEFAMRMTNFLCPVIGGIAAVCLLASPASAQQPNESNFEREHTESETQEYRNTDDRERRSESADRREKDIRDTKNRRVRDGELSQRHGEQPAGLGVTVVDSDQGVRVRQVMQNSPAEQAGIRPGDEILAISGRRLNQAQQLVQLVRNEDPGSDVDIQILRNGQRQILVANLESRREALNMYRRGYDDRNYRDGDDERRFRSDMQATTPWSSDDLRQHVNAMEQQIRRMQQELDDLKRMLGDDPSGRDFAMSDSRRNTTRDGRNSGTMRDRSTADFDDNKTERRNERIHSPENQ